MDSLVEPSSHNETVWCRPGYFDFVFTNPPFGVAVDPHRPEYAHFDTAHSELSIPLGRQASEWLFIEQALRWIKPGGKLAIVLPKSVLTNPSSSHERNVIAKMGFLKALIVLPPETFSATGTQTNTVVAFIDKLLGSEDDNIRRDVLVSTISNVGFDSTGRKREGSHLYFASDREHGGIFRRVAEVPI